jgi:lipopolysaccharide/colanic/teichoic acid biosynthesis glycosyltransferase
MSQLITEIWPSQPHLPVATANEVAARRSIPLPAELPEAAITGCPAWKRAMDVVGAGFGLVILSPLLFLIAAYVKCVSRGPALFRQQRYGLDGAPFEVWKFRTMTVSDHPAQHQTYVLDLMSTNSTYRKRDHELTLITGGGVMRRLGLDELPQLINVLVGEMSLVGPRPDVVPPEKYEDWQRGRFRALPGITGLWQVSGKNHTSFATMIHLDIAYIHLRSLWLDLFILARTVPAILFN